MPRSCPPSSPRPASAMRPRIIPALNRPRVRSFCARSSRAGKKSCAPAISFSNDLLQIIERGLEAATLWVWRGQRRAVRGARSNYPAPPRRAQTAPQASAAAHVFVGARRFSSHMTRSARCSTCPRRICRTVDSHLQREDFLETWAGHAVRCDPDLTEAATARPDGVVINQGTVGRFQWPSSEGRRARQVLRGQAQLLGRVRS